MWRIINYIGKGLRSVRPSQCGFQDSSDEGFVKYHNHYYQYNEDFNAQATSLRHYSAPSSWSPLTVRSKQSQEGRVCSPSQDLYSYHYALHKAENGIHTKSLAKRSTDTERENNVNWNSGCPPWHWEIFQDNPQLKKYCSEKEQEEDQETNNSEKTCFSKEWKEIFQSSSTLHALGWGSAAAITWSLYHDWNKLHPCPYKRYGQVQTSWMINKNCNSNRKYDMKKQVNKEEELLNYHRPFKDFFTFENSTLGGFQTPDANNSHKKYLNEFKDAILKCNPKSTENTAYEINQMESPKYHIQERTVPVYSVKKNNRIGEYLNALDDHYGEKRNTLEEITEDEDKLYTVIESQFLEDEWSEVLNKTDSGCVSDSIQSYHSQTSNTKLDNARNQDENKSSFSKMVSEINQESHVTGAIQFETFAKEESKAQQVSMNNSSSDIEAQILHKKLLKIVKEYHEEQLLGTRRNQKALLDTKPEEAVIYLQTAVLMGDITSAYNLALCYHTGHGIKQDFEKARKLYEVAAAAGHGWAIYNLAVMFYQGLGGPFLPEKAHNLLLQAAEMGVKEAEEAVSLLEKDKQKQEIVEEEDESLFRCYSEPCLQSAFVREWPSSYSAGDLQSLVDEDDWTKDELFTVCDSSQNKVQL